VLTPDDSGVRDHVRQARISASDSRMVGVRVALALGRRWTAAVSFVTVAAIAGVSFAQQDKPAPAPQPGIVTVRGRVLLPNGQPAAEATVRAIKWVHRSEDSPRDEMQLLATLSTTSQGEFQVNISEAVLKEVERGVNLWATLSGYGLAVHPLVANEKSNSIELRLADEQTIRGRIIDLEGRPARDARVEVMCYIDATRAAIDEWLTSASGKEKPVNTVVDKLVGGQPASIDWARNNRGTAILRVNSVEVVSDAIVSPVKTNAEGRFELKGIGRDRLVILRISAARSVTLYPVILTRPLQSNPFRPDEISGPEFERVVSPSAAVEGSVTDDESGKPIPGALINPWLLHQTIGLAGDFALAMQTTSDATGHYRLEGLDTRETNEFDVIAGGLPYFRARERVRPTRGLDPIHVDVRLRRGIWVTGRAYDQVTGKPVEGTIGYWPSSRNNLRHGFSVTLMRGAHTDPDGRFRLLVLRGRGMVYLSCKGDYRFNAGASQVKDFRGFSRTGINRVCEIDVSQDAPEAHVDLPADPGQNVLVKFTDAAGKPLAGVDAYGLRFPQPRPSLGYGRTFSESDSAILYAASPEELRWVWLRHRDSGLSKLFRFKPKPGETERTVVLDPPAIVTGRFVTPEGKPVTGLTVACGFNAIPRGGPPTIRGFPDVLCDAQGRFRRDLPAGDWISLSAGPGEWSPVSPGWASIVRTLKVNSGELIDLGDITIEQDPKHRGQVKARHGAEKRTSPP
jgi:protocatechuate 3,4-dioxygenase beta subunit